MKRSVTIAGHQTSISLEPEFWTALDKISKAQNQPLAALIRQIDEARVANPANTYSLSSHIRVYVLKYFRSNLPAEPTKGE